MDILKIQKRLAAAGYDPGAQDGVMGPKTMAAILNFTVKKNLGSLSVLLGRAMISDFKKYEINTDLRMMHFIAQAAHETANFRTLVEFGSGKDLNRNGFDDYLERYDFRGDLGNNKAGMGQKYRGRGIFQLTGLFNYIRFGSRISIDLAKNPDRAAEPEVSVLIACLYWNDKKLSPLADKDDIVGITKKINGGRNGLEDRQAKLARLKLLFA
jgi:putative chitinase